MREGRASGPVRDARRELKRLLKGEDGFLGIGEGASGEGAPTLVVHVASRESVVCSKIPAEIQGVPVTVEVVGKPRRYD